MAIVVLQGFITPAIVIQGLGPAAPAPIASSIIIQGLGSPLLPTQGYGPGVPISPFPPVISYSFVDADAGTAIPFVPGLSITGSPPPTGLAPVDPDAGTLIIMR